jgi:hypothetical protein
MLGRRHVATSTPSLGARRTVRTAPTVVLVEPMTGIEHCVFNLGSCCGFRGIYCTMGMPRVRHKRCTSTRFLSVRIALMATSQELLNASSQTTRERQTQQTNLRLTWPRTDLK